MNKFLQMRLKPKCQAAPDWLNVPLHTIIITHIVCAYHCAQLSFTILHRTDLIIFSLILQTTIIAQMISSGEDGGTRHVEIALSFQVVKTVFCNILHVVFHVTYEAPACKCHQKYNADKYQLSLTNHRNVLHYGKCAANE